MNTIKNITRIAFFTYIIIVGTNAPIIFSMEKPETKYLFATKFLWAHPQESSFKPFFLSVGAATALGIGSNFLKNNTHKLLAYVAAGGAIGVAINSWIEYQKPKYEISNNYQQGKSSSLTIKYKYLSATFAKNNEKPLSDDDAFYAEEVAEKRAEKQAHMAFNYEPSSWRRYNSIIGGICASTYSIFLATSPNPIPFYGNYSDHRTSLAALALGTALTSAAYAWKNNENTLDDIFASTEEGIRAQTHIEKHKNFSMFNPGGMPNKKDFALLFHRDHNPLSILKLTQEWKYGSEAGLVHLDPNYRPDPCLLDPKKHNNEHPG